MSTAAYTIDDSARSEDADIWFALPPGFVPFPLDELAASPCDAAPAGGPLTRLGPVLRLAQLLLEAGAVHCCLGLHADDEGDGGPLLSLFTLARRDTDWAPRSVLAGRAAAGAVGAEHIETLDLPCGPASLVQTRLKDPPELELGAPSGLLQVTAYVPSLDGRRIAILSLATTAIEHAGLYRDLLRDIAATVSFEDPLRDMSDDVDDKD
ncbi:MAG: hypothetical protein JF597_20265 [Streptomyces sp.]|jgi:hypothetical protein|uniref:hypothetical protein n=1 Tax=Streptomyces sp. TaxID=1931 RepID=UPI0025F16DBA|nr:hypothetical protein [Streptomyces sp.]MBW8795836.1 hypothetical protein [Streptomyces sp.]